MELEDRRSLHTEDNILELEAGLMQVLRASQIITGLP